MKVLLRLVFLCQIASLSLKAQAPHKFSYQTVIRNSGNQLLANQQVGIKISIRQGSEAGNSVYAERHTPTTNANGLASLQIGSGTVLTGNFVSIDWAQGPYFITTETDPNGGTNYSIVATQQLLSVPYALYAENAGSSAPGPQGPAGPTGAQGPAGANGQTTVTKTTPEGAGINCAEGGVKLEFGFDTNGNGILDENEVNAALSRYVCNGSGPTIAAGNGIAINGDTITNTSVSPWLSGDSSIYYLNGKVGIGTSSPQAQFETTGDIVVNSVRIGAGPLIYGPGVNTNTILGINSLMNNSSGGYNTAIGAYTLEQNTGGIGNTALGHGSLQHNTDGLCNVAVGTGASMMGNGTFHSNNTVIGYNAASQNLGNSNVAIGKDAMAFNKFGGANVVIGAGALGSDTSASYNIAIGLGAMELSYDASFNIAIGNNSTNQINSGMENSALGHNTLSVLQNGSGNTAIGNTALGNLQNGSSNISIGAYSGLFSEGSYNTFLGINSTPLNNISISNSVGLGYDAKPQESNEIRLGNYAVQSISGVVNFTTYSDKRYKRRVEEDVPGLDFITRLRPVTYNLDVEGLMAYNMKNSAEKRKELGIHELDVSSQMATKYSGFIAQEVEQAAKAINYSFSGIDAPANKDGLYGLRYSDFIIPMVKSIQELHTMLNDYAEISKQEQKKIEELQKEINTLKKRGK